MSIVRLFVVSFLLTVHLAAFANNSAVQLPSWGQQSDIQSTLSSKGEQIANIISSVVAILSILGMLIGAAMFSVSRTDDGKKWILGSVCGLIVAGSVYGIVGLFI